MENTKQQVRDFYNRIGWSQVSEGVYQNARYEDLRPVAQEYIHNCHMRILRHISMSGNYLLDAGSGPVQYPEYLTYSANYKHRVCADISITALREARKKVGEHGLYVVADVAYLPFNRDAFEGAISMHTIHHLPIEDHKGVYIELIRVLKPGYSAAIVNGWHQPLLMHMAEPLISLGRFVSGRSRKQKKDWSIETDQAGTFVKKMTPRWLKRELNGAVNFEIHPWRSLSPRFMRWFIRPKLAGKQILTIIFWLEERFPKFFGEHGQYPLIVVIKPEAPA